MSIIPSRDPAAWVARVTHLHDQHQAEIVNYMRERAVDSPAHWAPVLALQVELRAATDHGRLDPAWMHRRLTSLDPNRTIQLAVLAHAAVVTSFMPAHVLWELAAAWQGDRAWRVLAAIDTEDTDDGVDQADIVAALNGATLGDMAALAVIAATGLSAMEVPAEQLASLANLAASAAVASPN